jgi:hypothetical protein
MMITLVFKLNVLMFNNSPASPFGPGGPVVFNFFIESLKSHCNVPNVDVKKFKGIRRNEIQLGCAH